MKFYFFDKIYIKLKTVKGVKYDILATLTTVKITIT